jgi:UDP-2,3-diacylglucosamine hydrolase
MRAIFISDAHLKGGQERGCQRLLCFFDDLRKGFAADRGGGDAEGEGGSVDQLIIAGDLFDFWFARGDAIYPGFRPVVEGLAILQRSGIKISLCEGNHDFFLDYFSERMGMEVFPEWGVIDLDGLRVLVSHGDTLDRENRHYLALRQFLRSPFSFRMQRVLPLTFLWWIARISSGMSKSLSGSAQDRLAERMYRFSLDKFQEGYDAVILGHCHKPIIRKVAQAGGPRTFATLGDWMTHGSYLLYDNGCFMMNRFSPEGRHG